MLAELLEELLDFRRQIVQLVENVARRGSAATILTFTDTTVPLTRSMSGANDGTVRAGRSPSRRPRRERRGNSSGAYSPNAPAAASEATATEARIVCAVPRARSSKKT